MRGAAEFDGDDSLWSFRHVFITQRENIFGILGNFAHCISKLPPSVLSKKMLVIENTVLNDGD